MKTAPKDLNWQKYHFFQHANLSEVLKGWILYPGSFMERLKQHSIEDAQIDVLEQSWQKPLAYERELLGLGLRSNALIRQVLIKSEQSFWMFARTVFPRQTLTGEQKQLAHLENRSLGSILFKDPALKRTEFEIAYIESDMPWYKKLAEYVNLNSEGIWARRSMFNLHGKQLLLTEFFLPDIEKI